MQPGGFPHQISDFIMASLHAGFSIDDIKEFGPDAELAAHSPTSNIPPAYID